MGRVFGKVAVIGAGVMGSGIAAHLANAGIPCLLLDIVPREVTPEEEKRGLTLESPEVRNRLALQSLQGALKAKPAAFFKPGLEKLITPGNMEDDLHRIAEVDWIIEVVKEDLRIKRIVFQNIAKHRKPGTPVTSNTSGLPIKDMMEGFDLEFRQHFFVTHFFNPVRYMRLLEIVAGEDTDPEVLRDVVQFGSDRLGKGIVFGKDTPNFIANRIGIHSVMVAMQEMEKHGLTVSEVDSILGSPMGRPKSAAFRTVDIVGLDTFGHVAQNLYDGVVDDEARDLFRVPAWMQQMIANGWLGDKGGQGFYKKVKSEGKKEIFQLDWKTLEYIPQAKLRTAALKAAKEAGDLPGKLRALLYADDPAGKYAWDVLKSSLIYAARRIPEIADDVVNVDRAMRWGFGWDLGPFEVWDAIGLDRSIARMQEEGLEVPELALQAKAAGGFYRWEDGVYTFFDVASGTRKPVEQPAGVITLRALKERSQVVQKADSCSLLDLGDGVLCLEFHSKMNAIDDQIIQMIHDAVALVERGHQGLVIANEADHFCVGANLLMMLMNARMKKWEMLEKVVADFQQANQRLKYSSKPTVAAPVGMALGGGCEVCMACNRVVAAAETYIGLVEVGVGLIPAGGGTKEMLRRLVGSLPPKMETMDTFPLVQRALETVGMAKVATSADEAIEMGFLTPFDCVSLNRDRRFLDAKKLVLTMAEQGFRPPLVNENIRLPGEGGYATLMVGLDGWLKGGTITPHDFVVAKKLAWVLCGGYSRPMQPVGEQYILDLEREAFLSLLGEPGTIARMQHMLQTGKPLRN
ncbi:MAG: 3-hydroxyacyl-CoA dehydrogenase NAD-binding domain-containing protein [Myxococcota bacterium]|nr:3-hydroxyacyl-CoA dehydrogenase NAD-binding domain-containing protein [Myxococcota bacterium]